MNWNNFHYHQLKLNHVSVSVNNQKELDYILPVLSKYTKSMALH